MIRTIRVIAVAGAALVGIATVPAVASAESSFASTGYAASASSSTEQGAIGYDTLGMGETSGMSALSVQLLGSLGSFLPGMGGPQPPTGVEPKADIFVEGCTNGLGYGMARFNNFDSNEPVDFSLYVNEDVVAAQTVAAEAEVDGVEFSGAVVGTFVKVLADGDEIESVEVECLD